MCNCTWYIKDQLYYLDMCNSVCIHHPFPLVVLLFGNVHACKHSRMTLGSVVIFLISIDKLGMPYQLNFLEEYAVQSWIPSTETT